MKIFAVFPHISKVEYKILCVVALIMIVLGAAPYIIGYLNTPQNHFFLGRSIFSVDDYAVYYTYIEQVKSGSWTNFDFYTSEEQERGIFQVSWFIPGVLARIFRISAIAAYHIWRIFLIPILIFVLYLFISLFFTDKFSRFTAFFLALFGSGWGAYALYFFPAEIGASPKFLPIDLWTVDANTFLSVLQTPHFILSLIFIILIFYFWILWIRTKKIYFSIFSGICALVLFNFHPHFTTVIYLPIVLFAALTIWLEKKFFSTQIIGLIIFFILSLPAVFYHLYLLDADFVLRLRSLGMWAIAVMPSVFAVLAGYGIFGAVGLWGAIKSFKKVKNEAKWQFLYIWLFSNLFLFFIPFVFPRRLTEGFQIPLAIFSALLIASLAKNFACGTNSFCQKAVLLFLSVMIFMPTTIFIFWRSVTVYFFTNPKEVKTRFYREKNIINAMDWLKDKTPEFSVILAEPRNANILPVFSLRKVFFGHNSETLFSQMRRKEVEWFFETDEQDELKKRFLKKEGINYIFWSAKEQDLGEFGPEEKDYLDLVYQNEEAKIYKVIGR